MMTFDEWLKEYNKLHNTQYNREDYGNNAIMRTDWNNYRYGITTNNGDGTKTTTFGDGSTATQQIPSNNENYGMPNTGGIAMDINDGATSTEVTNAINEYNQTMKEYNEREYEYRKYVDNLAQKNWENEFEFEKEKFRQQLKENDLTRTREDTVYQRTMHDLALAGINPLMVAKLGTDPTSLGQVAGNAPTTPSFHGGSPSPIQSQAGVIAQEINSLRDYKIMQKQIKLDQEKLKEEERRNKSEERIKEAEVKLEVNKLWKEISIARNQLKSANVNAGEERKLKNALQKAENAHDIIMEFIKYGISKSLQDDAQEAQKELQDSINKIKSIETGNKVVDTVVNLALQLIKSLR